MTNPIETNRQKPKSATVDGNTATQHSLPDQIKADQYLKGKEATSGSKRGFQLGKFKPPGATG